MNTSEPFIKHWFSGVNSFLETATKEERTAFLKECAHECSVSYPLGLYREAFSEGRSLPEALEYLKKEFTGFDYTLSPEGVELVYAECGCDLFKEGLITSEHLCECSEASLSYIWEDLFGQGSVTVRAKKTIIRGDDSCVFEIRWKR